MDDAQPQGEYTFAQGHRSSKASGTPRSGRGDRERGRNGWFIATGGFGLLLAAEIQVQRAFSGPVHHDASSAAAPPVGLYAIFRAARPNPTLRRVQMKLDRRGSHIFSTYQVQRGAGRANWDRCKGGTPHF